MEDDFEADDLDLTYVEDDPPSPPTEMALGGGGGEVERDGEQQPFAYIDF